MSPQVCCFRQIAKSLNAVIQRVGLECLTVEDVRGVRGVGPAKATVLFAMIEFFRRKLMKQTAPVIDSVERAAEQLSYIREKKQEYSLC